jgi:hypothetical protein
MPAAYDVARLKPMHAVVEVVFFNAIVMCSSTCRRGALGT